MTIGSPKPFDWRLFESLTTDSERILMLDYDGTLAPFTHARMDAVPYPGINEALAELTHNQSTRVVIVSGRPITELATLLASVTGLELWGAHGWERRHSDGHEERWRVGDEVEVLLKRAYDLLHDHIPDECLETKIASLAVHTRALSAEEARRVHALAESHWKPFDDGLKMRLRRFDGGVELRTLERSKATVVEVLRAESANGTFFTYLGDDNTDEDAFMALKERDWSILVCGAPRSSCARYWLKTPDELLKFLHLWTHRR